MNQPLAQASKVDPRWARQERHRILVVKVLTPVTVLAIVLGTLALLVGIRNETKITRVERSACAQDAESIECQSVRAEAERAAGVKVTCIPFHRAGYECPKPGSELALEGQMRKGVVPSKPESGTSLPGPVSTGPTEEPSAPVETPAATPEESGHPVRELVEPVVAPVVEGVHEAVCNLPLALCP